MAGEWRQTTLGDVIELKRGYDLPARERRDGPYPIVSSSGISGYHAESKAKGPGVVTGRYGTLGEVFFLTDDYWPLNTALYVRDFKGNHPRFISYFLTTLDFLAYSDKAAVPGLNRNHLHSANVRIPDPREQQAIACILGALDDKIELNRRMNRTLEGLARAIFQSWFVDFAPVRAKAAGRTPAGLAPSVAALFPSGFENSAMGDIPQGWKIGNLLDIADLLSGGTPKTSEPDYWNGQIPWASAKDVSQCGETFLLDTERSITLAGLENSATQIIPALSSVVVARGATTGRMTMLGSDIAMNQTCYALRTKCETPLFLYLLLRTAIGSLVHAAHGSVFDNITTATFRSSRILLPSKAVMQVFEASMKHLFERILAALRQSRTLAALRDALLPKLISGELRVPDVERIVGRCL
jgi:type I restriction enzyme S subunit